MKDESTKRPQESWDRLLLLLIAEPQEGWEVEFKAITRREIERLLIPVSTSETDE